MIPLRNTITYYPYIILNQFAKWWKQTLWRIWKLLSDVGLYSSCHPVLRTVFKIISWSDWSTNPRLFFWKSEKAKDQESKFDPNYGSHGNNTHCIAKVNYVTFDVKCYVIKVWIISYESFSGNKYHHACAIQCSQEISWANGQRSRNISGWFH